MTCNIETLSRRTLLRTGVCACASAALPQSLHAIAPFNEDQIICGLNGFPSFTSTKAVHEATPEALAAVQLIVDTVGLEQNFVVLRGEFTRKVGGFATIRRDKRYIVYDQDEFTFANGRTDWIGMALMAHEIGHHLADHIYVNGTTRQNQELEADRFAGVALARLGATKAQALAWTAGLSETGGETHPPRSERIVAVSEGWEHGQRQMVFETKSCQAPIWEGPVFEVGGHQCRVARVCTDGKPVSRIACADYKGDWVWQD